MQAQNNSGYSSMIRNASPVELWKSGLEFAALVTETQIVVAYRTLGMFGLLAAAPGETTRMMSEKGPAFAEASMAASRAAIAGRRPDEVFGAWMRPLRRRTRSNARRLRRAS